MSQEERFEFCQAIGLWGERSPQESVSIPFRGRDNESYDEYRSSNAGTMSFRPLSGKGG
ncbi:hypothetical protein [Phormidesmis priestleyi]